MLNFFRNTDLVDSRSLLQILNEIISPRLSDRGFEWNKKYLWFDQPKNSIRHVFQYSRLKGETGTFAWGVCLDFVPIIASNKLKYSRTDKSVTLHLFEWPDEYSNSFFNEKFEGGKTTHWGKHQTKKSIKYLFDKYEQKIMAWYDHASTIENLIEIADQQIATGKSYNIHNPSPKLVLAFLQARANQLENAKKTIEELQITIEMKDLLLKKIKVTS